MAENVNASDSSPKTPEVPVEVEVSPAHTQTLPLTTAENEAIAQMRPKSDLPEQYGFPSASSLLDNQPAPQGQRSVDGHNDNPPKPSTAPDKEQRPTPGPEIKQNENNQSPRDQRDQESSESNPLQSGPRPRRSGGSGVPQSPSPRPQPAPRVQPR